MFHKTFVPVLTHRTIRSIVVAAAALFLLAAAAGTPEGDLHALQAKLASAKTAVVDDYTHVAAETGAADQIVERLDADEAALALADPADPAGSEALRVRILLDVSLAEQVTNPAATSSSSAHGPQMRLVKSSADQTLQPLALYVPGSINLDQPAPLVIMLHSQEQTEADLISEPALRQLADASGAILAVPYARGDRSEDTTTQADVYDALAFVLSAYKIDARRIYLAGFSYGAFEAFMLAPHDPGRWSGVLSIAGSLTNGDKDAFVRSMQGKSTFLVIGSDDPIVKAQYVEGASAFLAANGIDSHFYMEKGGVHSLESLLPSLQRAWNDMLAGVHFGTPEPDAPSPLPTPSQRY
ncbi:MAG TPA: hypothetical protein VEJ41_05105 [Candidatus Acidoferrales bacterium]|nr:hypothetical protein [Candidatus Acidoferrales bacterium]